MTGKICPLLQTKCIENECEWFIDTRKLVDGQMCSDARRCAVVALANNLKFVTDSRGRIKGDSF